MDDCSRCYYSGVIFKINPEGVAYQFYGCSGREAGIYVDSRSSAIRQHRWKQRIVTTNYITLPQPCEQHCCGTQCTRIHCMQPQQADVLSNDIQLQIYARSCISAAETCNRSHHGVWCSPPS
mmetsp:Transcript_11548/g.16173  ORF Transcript_11548/g.16173 Transcript_11548/m.16173 type:complete len:122 (-) Transcript_11548:8-373(-)